MIPSINRFQTFGNKLQQPLASYTYFCSCVQNVVSKVFNPPPPSATHGHFKVDPLTRFCITATCLTIGTVTLLTYPLIYPALWVIAKIGATLAKYSLNDFQKDPFYKEIEQKAHILKQEIALLKSSNDPLWKEKSIKLIRNNRYENCNHELMRLRILGHLTPEREFELDDALFKVQLQQPSNHANKLQAKTLIAQAIEINDLFGETHRVFIHAQAIKWVIISHLIKECYKKFFPCVDVRQFKFIRPDSDIKKPTNAFFQVLQRITDLFKSAVQEIFNYKTSFTTVQEFIESKDGRIDDSKMETREKLLSVDAFFFNYSKFESAIFFLVNNENIFNNTEVIREIAETIIQHFHPKISQNELSDFSKRIMGAIPSIQSCANLFTFCIPKVESPQTAFRAHPYGPPCHCHPASKDHEILDQLQQQQHVANSSKCKAWPKIPQFRLYTPNLKPGKDRRSYLLTPFPKRLRKDIKLQVKKVVSELFDLVNQK